MIVIPGFAIGGFRSYPKQAQYVGTLTKINLFAGENNVGKSNLLRFVSQHLTKASKARGKNYDEISDLDLPRNGEKGSILGLPVLFDSELVQEKLKEHPDRVHRITKCLFESESLGASKIDSKCAWYHIASSQYKDEVMLSPESAQALVRHSGFDHRDLEYAWSQITRRTGGALFNWIKELVDHFSPWGKPIPVATVDALRAITPGEADPLIHSGKGLIPRLAELKQPAIGQYEENRRKFAGIERLLRDVLSNDTARIDIPHTNDVILVDLNGKTLPLSYLGTGVHQVIILAAAATSLSRHLVCIEEPEIHLHPILQRKFLQYLHDNTDNQYLIATHSAHLLDFPGASLFHVTIADDVSTVRKVATAGQRWDLVRALGARASDIVQSNHIVWVEGPSDRLYLKHWISAVDPTLIEGIHFSIVFYGGKVLSHFTAEQDPEEVEDLIEMLAVNRNSSIVMDRDRPNATDPINATKQRIEEEISKSGGISWVTCGREMENYLPKDQLRSAISKVSPSAKIPKLYGPFSHRIPENVSKVAVAKAMIKQQADLDHLKLREHVVKLANHIRQSNGLPPIAVATSAT